MKLVPFEPHRTSEGQRALVSESLLNNLDSLYSTAYRLTRRTDVAEDVAQETARKALQATPQLRHESNIRGWLFKILINVVRRYLRHDRTWEELKLEQEHQEQVEGSQDLEAVAQAAIQDVRQALSRLPPWGQAVVILIDLEGFTIVEVASMLKVPLGTVASRLARARRQLRDSLLTYRKDSSMGGRP